MHRPRSLVARKGALAMGTLALAVVSLTTGISSLALFTDQASNTGNAFTTGEIDISVSPVSAFFSVSNMLPGDVSARTVTVSNSGTAQLRWSVDSTATTATGGLDAQLDLAIGQMSAAACSTWDGTSALATGSFASVGLTGQVLNAGANVVLCFRAELPLSTGNSFQGRTAGTTFQFDAEQTANNP